MSNNEGPPPAVNAHDVSKQVEAVLDVLAPYVEAPEPYQPQRWPIFRFDHEGHSVMPTDGQLRSLAEQIVTAVRTAADGAR